MSPPLALLAALCVATLFAPLLATPRGLLFALLALAALCDAGARLCSAVVVAIYAAAWAVSSPFLSAGRAFLRASRRITSGRAP